MLEPLRLEPLMIDPRPTCSRCRRPASVCYCSFLTSIPTRTRIVLLQHPRERDVAIGTARLASLCLPNAELHIGVDWTHSSAVRRVLSDPARPAVLLYPGDGAVDVAALGAVGPGGLADNPASNVAAPGAVSEVAVLNAAASGALGDAAAPNVAAPGAVPEVAVLGATVPPDRPLTLVVIDGTWPQTRKMVRQNPLLAALPRLSFTPPTPSEYRIRREPRADFVSTLEALVHVLGHLEGDPQRFQALMDPFRAMIDMQIDHETRLSRPWSRRKRPARLEHSKPLFPMLPLPPGKKHRLCITLEANAWPRRAGPDRTAGAGPDELVYLLAERLETGERLEAFIAPRAPLNPATPFHTGLCLEQLMDGLDWETFCARWGAFVRDTDLVCGWGDYCFTLLERQGLPLPAGRLDLRRAVGDLLRERPGTLERCLERLGLEPAAAWGHGRGGARHGQLTALAEGMVGEAS